MDLIEHSYSKSAGAVLDIMYCADNSLDRFLVDS